MSRTRHLAATMLSGACVAAATIAIQVAATAQDQPPQVFRAGANLVYVDAYPKRQDRLVEGLTAKDFQVFEDGTPQTVQTFEFITFATTMVDSERRDPTSVADSERQAADPRNRLFVVYLDRFHTTRNGSRDSRAGLVDFLNRTIGASDLFAVMTPETPISGLTFVRRTGTIESELAKHWDWGEQDQLLTPRTPAERHLVSCALEAYTGDAAKVDAIHRRYRERLTQDSLDALIRRLRDIRDERTNFLLVSEGWVPEGERAELGEFPASRVPPVPAIGVGRGGQLVRGNPQNLNPDAAGCRADIVHLAQMDFIDRFRDLVSAAERANVTFYPVDVGGLRGHLGTTETLRTLAGATDGYAAVNTNDIAGAFRRIADRLTSYYLLGYYSTNTVNDGKFRKIEVKVTAPGVSVSARRGYLSPPSDAVVAAAKAAAAATAGPPVADDVANAFGQLARLTADQELFATAVVRGPAIDVVADLAEREVDRGRWAKGATVEAAISDATGATTSGKGAIEAGRRSALVRVPVAPDQKGPWRVRLRIGDGAGALETRIDAERPAANRLPAPLLLRGAGPPRAPLQPVAQASFRRSERLRVQWTMPREGGQPTAQVLDRRGQPLGSPLPATDTDNGGERLVTFDLALGSLAPADYVIRLTIGQGDATENHLVPFRVTR